MYVPANLLARRLNDRTVLLVACGSFDGFQHSGVTLAASASGGRREPQQAQLASGLSADLRLFLACRDDTPAREDESHKSEERRKASE